MTTSPQRNMAASVRQRLLNLAHEQHEVFDLILTRYANERLLYRLSISPARDRFVLKGATLFALWFAVTHRPTRDLDLMGYGAPHISHLEEEFRHLCSLTVDDGIQYDADSVHGQFIREDAVYPGVRITLLAELDRARIALQIDIGFGDAITPAPDLVSLPTLLSFPQPRLQAYPIYTVVSEKCEALVKLGMANTRTKDYYDLWSVASNIELDGVLLCRAFSATFTRRDTQLPRVCPLPLSDAAEAESLQSVRWAAFVNKNHLLSEEVDWTTAVTLLRQFLLPPLFAAAENASFTRKWMPSSGWRDAPSIHNLR